MVLAKARRRLQELTKATRRGIAYGRWHLPDLEKLTGLPTDQTEAEAVFEPPVDPKELEAALLSYGVQATVSDFWIGSAVTTYQVDLPVGFKLDQLIRREDDIARDLKAPSLRILRSFRDTGDIGIEVANEFRFTVNFKSMLQAMPSDMTLPMPMGEDTFGERIYADLAKMPHLLVAGLTGSGKSVFLNGIIASILATKMPYQVQLLLIDPKQVEFVAYEDVPHLLEPIAYDLDDAQDLLDKAVEVMEDRFEELRKHRCKKLEDYNEKTGNDLPYIVFVVDEYADLIMMGNTKERKATERKIARIAQKARAVGMHLILATQKPMATVVTPLLKANLPARVAFSVTSWNDSKVILDLKGAEHLCGNGDMLFKDPTARGDQNLLRRIQAPWVPEEDIERILQ